MNAIAPVPQFQPSSDAAHFKPGSDSDSGANAVGGQDFSSTLHAQNSRPVRKNAAARSGPASRGGNPSPAGGNPPPSVLPPASPPPTNAKVATPPSGTAAPAAAVPTTVSPPLGGATTTTAGARQAGSATTSQNPNAPGAPPDNGGDPTAPVALADQNPLSSPPIDATSPPPVATGMSPLVLPPDTTIPADTTSADAVATSAAAVLAATAADATTSAAASATAAKSAASTTAPAAAMTQSIAQVAPATSTRASSPLQGNQPIHSNGNTASAGDSTTATDATAQSVPAAAAVARAVNATDFYDPASQDQLATPDTGLKPAVAAPIMLAPVAAAAAGAPAAVTTAVNTALATARSLNALAILNTAIDDKTSRDGNSDAPLNSVSSDGSVGAAQLLTTNTITDAATTTTFKVAAPVETSEFGQGVADRVTFMVDGNISSAKLQVNPPALGPIEVRIALQGSHAQVSFTSHSALTRDALESSAPKLREMLGSQGFGQVSVDVSHGSFQDRSAQSSPYQSSAVNARDSSLDAAQPVVRSGARTAAGVLDAYA